MYKTSPRKRDSKNLRSEVLQIVCSIFLIHKKIRKLGLKDVSNNRNETFGFSGY